MNLEQWASSLANTYLEERDRASVACALYRSKTLEHRVMRLEIALREIYTYCQESHFTDDDKRTLSLDIERKVCYALAGKSPTSEKS